MKKKIALLMACVMAFGVAVGGTLAWLTDNTAPVVNTFTDSDINITLTETDVENNQTPNANAYQMIPGYTIAKDPKVTVEAGSEACWLFVEITESANFDDYMEYAVVSTGDKAWTQGLGTDNIPTNVYYQKIDAKTTANTDYPVLTDNTVTVREGVTKGMMDAIDGFTATNTDGTDADELAARPTLTFKAYAVQLYKDNKETPTEFTAADAWAARPTT